MSKPLFDASTLNLKFRNDENSLATQVPDLLLPVGLLTHMVSSSCYFFVAALLDLSLRVFVSLFREVFEFHLSCFFFDRESLGLCCVEMFVVEVK